MEIQDEADSWNNFDDQGKMEDDQEKTWSSADKVRSLSSSQIADEVVGFESEKASIINQLRRGSKKLEAVAIVGMAGLGKTTLATKVYKDSDVTCHFHVKACCSISQVFDRRRVLLELLHQIQPGESNLVMDEDNLSQKLWRSLKKRRYLIFIDDIWDTKAFELLKGSLPDDCNQSRILLISRHGDVVPEALLHHKPLFLPHLTDDESLELLRKKLFPAQKDWPSELHEFGMEIAKYCKGLPLTVVIIAGLLKTMEQEGWKDVLKALRSSISDVKDQCESTIELSYKYLPDHLKPCFLWFGAFPEDHEYSVKRMIRLWIAEGLVRKSESKSLEDVGQDYLNTLIDIGLVMNAGKRSVGGFKGCRIHDLIHDFCLRKASKSPKVSIVNRLTGGSKKLRAVAIVGMPGSRKTTLATKVYKDPSVTHHFHVKAFCSISQVFDRRSVFLELLHQIQPGESNLVMDEENLSQKLWRSLKGRRYLIFIDDIWDSKAFDLLKESLPDDLNQSRILLTSRHGDVVPEALLDGLPLFLPHLLAESSADNFTGNRILLTSRHCDVVPEASLDDKPPFLRHLTMGESLELLQRKLFPTQKDWPSELHEFGMEIAEYCKGLPLVIDVIAGLLKATTGQLGWKDVLKTLRSGIFSDVTDQCERTIELSYRHLLDHLKPCFLWFGAFPEGHGYSAKKMIWLWIAEGLVRKSESKSLEDVGLDYMNTLIDRGLVMNAGKRSVGGFKGCRIHDLIHDFCLRKASEDSFYHILKEGDELSSDESQNLSCLELGNLRRLCVWEVYVYWKVMSKPEYLNGKVFCPRLRTLLFFNPTEGHQKLDMSYIFRTLKLLRVLGIDEVELAGFPSEIGALIQLRYLAIQVSGDISPAIGKLSKLETLILNNILGGAVSMPDTVWNMQKLRHLHSRRGAIELPIDSCDSSCNLLELDSLSTLYVMDCCVMEKQLRKFPNIRRMKCVLKLDTDGCVNHSKVMDFSFSSKLESLSLFFSACNLESSELIFPENIKKLSLHATEIPWNKISSIAKLLHLEVLKLQWKSFVGDTWHVEEGDFPELKYLRLRSLYLVNWTAASDDLFPNLEKLVLEDCHGLQEIPECLEYVASLETIEVIRCSEDVVSLVKKVYEFHKDTGNSALQFHERETTGPRYEFFDNENRALPLLTWRI